MLKPQKAHYNVNIWFERDRSSIVVTNINDKVIAEWWDEDVQNMFEDGFFISGKGSDRLAQSVLGYLEKVGIIKAKTYTYGVI